MAVQPHCARKLKVQMTEPVDGDAGSFPLVSVLFITYKRFDFLELALQQFRANTNYPNLHLVVADDGSGPEIQQNIRQLPFDDFALSAKNRGLGANMNQGLRMCKGKYVLVIQDDCMCYGPSNYLTESICVLEANPKVGLINFAGARHPPDYANRLAGSTEPCYITPEPLQGGKIEFFLYSDQPHVQSRAAIDHVGPYLESRDMEECERDYNHRWQRQTRFATAVFPYYYMSVFFHEGYLHSFRTSRLRYKVHALLQPAKPFLMKCAPGIFRIGKEAVQSLLRLLEKSRVVR